MLRFAALLGLLTAMACTNANDLNKPVAPLGDFAFGHNIVVANNMVKGPVSRDASEEEWVTALKSAIGDRFERYEGDRLYHFGVSVQGYVLAQPGVPIVLSPKSVLILNLDVWDDAKGKRMSAEPKQITVMESLSGETILGSGLTQSKEVQIENLSRNAAKLIQNHLRKMHREEGWFGPETPDVSKTVAETAAPAAASAAEDATGA